MTRNFVFGSPSTEYLNKFQLLYEAQTQTLQKYLPGQNIGETEIFCREMLGVEEPFFSHSLGHGVGIEIHELPTVSNRSMKMDVFHRDEVVTCEPGLYYPGRFGIRIEDLVVIDAKTPKILSKTPRKLIYL